MPTNGLAGRLAWRASLKERQVLYTVSRLSPFTISQIAAEGILITTKNGRRARLRYSHLAELWQNRRIVQSQIDSPTTSRTTINSIVNHIWIEAGLKPDYTNESYYWATVHFCWASTEDWDMQAIEGNQRLVTHLLRERDRALAEEKKRDVLAQHGTLACEACGFDFASRYPKLGDGFAEVHHRRPIADGHAVVFLKDLAILCANCHRMIHRTLPLKPVEAFRDWLLQAAPMSEAARA